tara:strand:- start:672 stop:1304 length:633 start_codon:yes stop_codon:yes gene_type:complete
MSNVVYKIAAALLIVLIIGIMVVSCDGTSTNNDDASAQGTVTIPIQNAPVIDWEGCSGKMNDHPCDFTLIDQYGMPWRLYEHTGDIIVLDISTIWCIACQYAAARTEENHDLYKDKGVIWVTIILENYFGQKPTLYDIKEWTTVFGIEDAVVLAGSLDLLDPLSRIGWYVDTLPLFIIINRDMLTTYRLDGLNEKQIQVWVEELLAADAL